MVFESPAISLEGAPVSLQVRVLSQLLYWELYVFLKFELYLSPKISNLTLFKEKNIQ